LKNASQETSQETESKWSLYWLPRISIL